MSDPGPRTVTYEVDVTPAFIAQGQANYALRQPRSRQCAIALAINAVLPQGEIAGCTPQYATIISTGGRGHARILGRGPLPLEASIAIRYLDENPGATTRPFKFSLAVTYDAGL